MDSQQNPRLSKLLAAGRRIGAGLQIAKEITLLGVKVAFPSPDAPVPTTPDLSRREDTAITRSREQDYANYQLIRLENGQMSLSPVHGPAHEPGHGLADQATQRRQERARQRPRQARRPSRGRIR